MRVSTSSRTWKINGNEDVWQLMSFVVDAWCLDGCITIDGENVRMNDRRLEWQRRRRGRARPQPHLLDAVLAGVEARRRACVQGSGACGARLVLYFAANLNLGASG